MVVTVYNLTAVCNVATTVTSYAYETRSSLVETVTLRLVVFKPYHHKSVHTCIYHNKHCCCSW